MHATFILAGRPFMASDSPQPHPFTFTPSISLFVTCETEAGQERLYATLSEDGEVLMPLGDYGLSRRFGSANAQRALDFIKTSTFHLTRPEKIFAIPLDRQVVTCIMHSTKGKRPLA